MTVRAGECAHAHALTPLSTAKVPSDVNKPQSNPCSSLPEPIWHRRVRSASQRSSARCRGAAPALEERCPSPGARRAAAPRTAEWLGPAAPSARNLGSGPKGGEGQPVRGCCYFFRVGRKEKATPSGLHQHWSDAPSGFTGVKSFSFLLSFCFFFLFFFLKGSALSLLSESKVTMVWLKLTYSLLEPLPTPMI